MTRKITLFRMRCIGGCGSLLLLLFLACRFHHESMPSESPRDVGWLAAKAAAVRKDAKQHRGPSDYVIANLKIESLVPGMGGFGFTVPGAGRMPSRTVIVYLASDTDITAFRAALDQLASENQMLRVYQSRDSLAIHHADFPFSELVVAQRALSDALRLRGLAGYSDGAVQSYADPRLNRVRVDVTSTATRDLILWIAESLDIPAGMLAVIIQSASGIRY